MFNTSRVHFKIIRQETEMTHQQRVSRSGSRVIERAVGESR